MENTTARVPNLFKIIIDKYNKAVENHRKNKAEKLSRESIPQDQYFAKLIQLINGARRQILIGGYDSPFMNNPDTIEALTKAARGYGDKNKVEISAVFPSSGINPAYKELAKETVFFNILSTDSEIPNGAIVIDDWVVSLWNSELPTHYLPEAGKGVIRRVTLQSESGAKRGTNIFYDLENRVKQQQIQQQKP